MTDEPMRAPQIIRSEADAWALLEEALNTDILNIDSIRFEGWPTWTMDAKGRDWHSTVPTRIMPPLLAVQEDLNRAFVGVRYGVPNLRRLRREDRDALEVVVKVDEGSSLFSANLSAQVNQIAEAAFGRMNGIEATIAVLGIGLLISAPVMYKAWLQKRLEEKKVDMQIELSRQETERMRVFAQATRQMPALAALQDDTHATANRMLKAARSGDVIAVKGVPVTSGQAGEIVQAERERAESVELSGAFTILGNRTDIGAGFRIRLRRLDDGLELQADALEALPADQKEVLKNAEWEKDPVSLVIQAEHLHGRIARAEIISAKTIDQTQD